MQLTVRDVARLLRVGENVVYRWVGEEGLPADLVNGQYRFNKAELLEWATVRKLEIPPTFFEKESGLPRLDEALRAGGVFHHVKAADREAALRAVLDLMPLPAGADRGLLLQVFLSRESLGTTAVGGGVALPHPRYPVVLPLPRPLVTLCFLERPIPYSAARSEEVHTLFALVCPTVRTHLALLARLACALRDPEFRGLIDRKAPAEEVLELARRLEDRAQADAGPQTEAP
jgi:PTS system nitrogen regulatory IIA component